MTPDKPTAAELAVELDDIVALATPNFNTTSIAAAKRALYAEHAARELLAAFCNVVELMKLPNDIEKLLKIKAATAVTIKYADTYGEKKK